VRLLGHPVVAYLCLVRSPQDDYDIWTKMLVVNILQIFLLLGPSAIFVSLLCNRIKTGPLIIILLVGLIFWPLVGLFLALLSKTLTLVRLLTQRA